ncbi:uncharacterized protein LOC140702571 [Pogona vitticeps]
MSSSITTLCSFSLFCSVHLSFCLISGFDRSPPPGPRRQGRARPKEGSRSQDRPCPVMVWITEKMELDPNFVEADLWPPPEGASPTPLDPDERAGEGTPLPKRSRWIKPLPQWGGLLRGSTEDPQKDPGQLQGAAGEGPGRGVGASGRCETQPEGAPPPPGTEAELPGTSAFALLPEAPVAVAVSLHPDLDLELVGGSWRETQPEEAAAAGAKENTGSYVILILGSVFKQTTLCQPGGGNQGGL